MIVNKNLFQSKLKVYVDRDGGKFDASRVITSTDRRAIDQLSQELEEQRELAANRLAELVSLEFFTLDVLYSCFCYH